MQALFVELPAFERHRSGHFDDDAFRKLQDLLLQNPEAGDVMEGAGGLRKLRFADKNRGKGKRGGIRIIDYWWVAGLQFWLFTLYNKNELDDLSPAQCKTLKSMIKAELDARKTP